MIDWISFSKSLDTDFATVTYPVNRALGYSRTELTAMKVFDFDTLYQKSGWSDFWSKLREEAVLTFESEHRAK
ncbi:hypothetical protein IIA28_21070, partial [candidate division KSB1 bacterium]|nr:hypothetical protein [candidate division KSB1 bacterium]